MSYELEWADLPEPAAAARERFQAWVDSGMPSEQAQTCAEPWFALQEAFQFDLNIAGMSVCREGMRRVGMSFQAEPQPFPVWPFEGLEDWRAADQSRRDAYEAAERAVLSQSVPGQIGIPEFKLRSNDSWLVSPKEIEQALDRYEASPAELRAELEADELWCDWLGWLRETVTHGGFRVG
ncbi:hypothetical protein ABZT08_31040 [Streptomyces sp. NPDC005526]|uniref:hypothetical protein n=1 Tax=Streptomyces sp. NPDC005526 TaxID=3156885 RepID=UPI0033A7FC14